MKAGGAGLQHVDAAVGQPRFDVAKDLVAKQRVAGRIGQRLGEVGDDDAVAAAVFLKKSQRVADDDASARALERAVRPLGQVGLREFDHLAVDIHHRAALHAGMAQDFAQRCALAAAENQDLGAVARARQRRMHQRFVVDLLVVLRALRVAVQNQHLAERGRLDDGDLLKLRTSGVINAVDGVMVEFRGSELLDVPLPVLGLRHSQRYIGVRPAAPRRTRRTKTGPRAMRGPVRTPLGAYAADRLRVSWSVETTWVNWLSPRDSSTPRLNSLVTM